MTGSTITYAKAGGPPVNWRFLDCFDGDQPLSRVIEIDTVAGFYITLDKVGIARKETRHESAALRIVERDRRG